MDNLCLSKNINHTLLENMYKFKGYRNQRLSKECSNKEWKEIILSTVIYVILERTHTLLLHEVQECSQGQKRLVT